MAIDPRISLAVQPLNVGQRFGQALQNVQALDLIGQRRDLAPLQQEQAQLQTDLLRVQQPAQIQAAELASSPQAQVSAQQLQNQQIAQNYATAIRPLLNDPDALRAELQNQKALMASLKLPTQGIDDDIAQTQTPEGLSLLAQEVESTLTPRGRLTSTGQRERDQLLRDAEGDPKSIATQSARIALGIDPRATGSAAITAATTPGLTEQVGTSQKIITEARKEGELSAQRKLEPSVKSAVTTAIAASKAAAAQAKTDKSNQKAFDVYQVGIDGLTNALGLTETGPFVGKLPAITANQQIADGAVAAMAPILKQMFRSAGEGIFTDKDQELLLRMVPTRTDRKAAIESKLSNIDAIVRAKLLTNNQTAPPSADEFADFKVIR